VHRIARSSVKPPRALRPFPALTLDRLHQRQQQIVNRCLRIHPLCHDWGIVARKAPSLIGIRQSLRYSRVTGWRGMPAGGVFARHAPG
jgi:hypothetical protein